MTKTTERAFRLEILPSNFHHVQLLDNVLMDKNDAQELSG